MPRQYYGLLETEECARKHFLLDWEIARRSHGLEKHIIKMDDREGGLVAQDADGDGVLDEVEEVPVRVRYMRKSKVAARVCDSVQPMDRLLATHWRLSPRPLPTPCARTSSTGA